MAESGKVYVNDRPRIRVSTKIDLTSATTKQILIHKPNGVKIGVTATAETPVTDGFFYYDTVAGDLDVKGTYKLMSYVVIGGKPYHGETAHFRVYDLWE